MNPITSFARALGRYLGRRAVARPRTPKLEMMTLEDRAVPAAMAIRSIDGTGNNLTQATWGATGTDFLRIAPAAYADGKSAPAGSTRPSARAVSNAIATQGDEATSDRMLSAMMYAWGQFIDHDMDLTNTGTGAFPIPVPTGDASFDPNGTGTQTIPLTRSAYDPATGTTNARQQVNSVTAWLDGSMIYGSNATVAASLRTMQGGQMKTSAGNLLPTDAAGNFLAGDTRVNENPELTSLQTLFVREHNRVAAGIAAANPRLTDEQIYQQARAWVSAEVQVITYNEWLPTLLGPGAMGPYRGYNPNVDPSISNEFATAGFRFGHSMLGDDIEFLDNNGKATAAPVSLASAFFNPSILKTNGVDSILKYLASDPSSEIDTKVVDSVRNFLFGAPGAGGLDLASLNIQRGRDHGLADYNTTRAAYGLPKVTDFAQITSNTDVQAKLKALYGTVNNIDLWVGALAEDHVAGGSVGATTRAILVDQFERLRAGDRFFYQNSFGGPQLQELQHTTLTDLIKRNTNLTNLQANPFVFDAAISGTAFNDANRNGKQDPSERGLAGRTIEVVDFDTGEVIATATTDANGRYRIGVRDGLRTGEYTVREVVPNGATLTTPSGSAIAITKGNTFVNGIHFGTAEQSPTTPPAPPQPAPQPPRPPMTGGANHPAPQPGPGQPPPMNAPRPGSTGGPSIDPLSLGHLPGPGLPRGGRV